MGVGYPSGFLSGFGPRGAKQQYGYIPMFSPQLSHYIQMSNRWTTADAATSYSRFELHVDFFYLLRLLCLHLYIMEG